MNWLKNFMIGRYGIDKLNIALLILSMILTLISSITDFAILLYISYIPLIVLIYRFLSKDTNTRLKENYKFLKFYNPAQNWIKKRINMLKSSKTHKYFKCPSCSQTVRVPRGKGKINIICPKCSTKFTKNT